MESPEYQAIVSCTANLQELMSHDCNSVTPFLLERQLITRTTADKMGCNSTGFQNAGYILSDVLSSIESKPELCCEFLASLKEVNEGYYEDVISKIEEKLKKEQQRSTSERIEVARYINKVKKKKSMAILMGLEAGDLKQITTNGPPEKKQERLAQWWVKKNGIKSLQFLKNILLQPALREKRLAREISDSENFEPESPLTSPIEVDAVFPHKDEFDEVEKQACTCPAVLNFLARYASHWEAIGKELIGQDQVRKIKSDGWAEGDEAAYVVEEWWSSTTDEVEFSWKKLKEAIDKTMEVRDQSNKPQQTSEVIASLEKEFEDMCKQYCNSLTENQKKYDQFREAIQDLPFRLRGLNIYYKDAIDNLVNKEDIKVFFKNVKYRLWNFVDYEFLKYLIQQSNDTELLERMTPYEKKVEEMCNTTTIHDFIVEWDPKFHNDDYYSSDLKVLSNFMIEFKKWDSKKYKISDLQSVLKDVLWTCTERISQKYGMAAFVLQKKISEGSVTVWIIFTVPTDPIQNNAELLDLDQKEIMELAQEVVCFYDDISLFVFEGYIVYPITAQSKVWNACREGNLATLNSLLDKVDIDHKYEEVYSQTALQCAAKYGHVNIVDFLMDRGADIDHRDARGRTALLIALQNCQKNVVRTLIWHQANLDIKEEVHGMCPLLEAAEYNDADIVKVLLDEKATITVKNNKNRNAFMLAARKGHIEVVQLLLHHKYSDIHVNEVLTDQDDNGCTVLHAAAESGNEKMIQLFLPNAEIIDHVNKNGKTAKDVAEDKGYTEIESILRPYFGDDEHEIEDMRGTADMPSGLTRETSQDESDTSAAASETKSKKKPLTAGAKILQHLRRVNSLKFVDAATKGKLEKVKYFLEEEKIDPNIRQPDLQSWTALLKACKNGHLDIVKLLLDHGASPNIVAENGFSPLVVATREGHYEIVKALLEHREKPDLTTVSDTGQNWPILMWSSQMKEVGKDYTKEEMTSNRLKITKALVEAGANINQEAHNGWTALMQASQDGNTQVVEYLCKQEGISINHESQSTWSALTTACRKKRDSIAKILVNAGASVLQKKKGGLTALHIACYQGMIDFIKHVIPPLARQRERRIDINVKDNYDMTPLMLAIKAKNKELVKYLVIEARADVNEMAMKFHKWTAIFFATKNEDMDTYRLLVNNKADTSLKDEHDNSLLQVAGSSFSYFYKKKFYKELQKEAKKPQSRRQEVHGPADPSSLPPEPPPVPEPSLVKTLRLMYYPKEREWKTLQLPCIVSN